MTWGIRKGLRAALIVSTAAPMLLAAGWAAAAETTVGELVVTAEKREETLRQVPQSVSVVSGASLERQQAFSLEDYAAQIPNFSINQSEPGAGRVVLRGVNTGGISSTVAVYMDETPFGSSSGLANGAVLAADFDTFDISRIEVLRGPQGTLYGASSLGGVLKFVTREPELGKVGFRGQAGVADTRDGGGSWNANGVANLPLGDRTAVRVSGYYRREGGFVDAIGTAGGLVDSNIDASEVYGGRGSIRFEPTDMVSLRLSAVLQDIKNDGNGVVDADPVTAKPLYGGLTQSVFYPQVSTNKYRLYNATLDWDLGFATLTSSTSYGALDNHFNDDGTYIEAAPGLTYGGYFSLVFSTPADPLGSLLQQSMEQRKWTQELRLASPSGEHFEWLAGLYYTSEKADLGQVLSAFPYGSLTPVALPLLAGVNLDSRYKEWAGFANGTIHFNDRFSLSLGGRYSHNKQRADETLDGLLQGGLTVYPTVESSENVFTFSVAPKLELSKDATLYARVAKGYRPGGPNALPPGAPANTPRTFDADTIISYETGIKADLMDGRGSLDVSAFYLKWSNIQLLANVNGFGVNANGGKARSTGVEFSLTVRPAEGLTLVASGAYTDAKLTADTPALVGGFDGDRLPFSPKLSFTFNGDYEHPLTADLTGYAGGTLAVVGSRYPEFDTGYTAAYGGRLKLDDYARVDLRLGVRADSWWVEVYGKNLTDSGGLINVGSLNQLPNGALGVSPIRPRTFGASVGASF